VRKPGLTCDPTTWYTLVGALVVDESHTDAFAQWMRPEGLKRPDGQYDVLKITGSGERACIRSGVASLDTGHAVARGDLERSGRVLSCHHSTPDEFEKF